MARRPTVTAFAAAALFFGALAPLHAENLMAGSWTIVKAEPAPWADGKDYRADRQDVPLFVEVRSQTFQPFMWSIGLPARSSIQATETVPAAPPTTVGYTA